MFPARSGKPFPGRPGSRNPTFRAHAGGRNPEPLGIAGRVLRVTNRTACYSHDDKPWRHGGAEVEKHKCVQLQDPQQTPGYELGTDSAEMV